MQTYDLEELGATLPDFSVHSEACKAKLQGFYENTKPTHNSGLVHVKLRNVVDCNLHNGYSDS
jgi:hypothetical protein